MARKVVGPTGSQRRRWLFLFGLVVAVGAAAFFIAGAGAVTGSPSNFESADGNMVLNTASNTDWNCFVGSDNFQTGTPDGGCAVKSGAQQVTADQNGEITWVNGQKFDTQCPALQTGNVPNKDDFTNIAAYSEFNTDSSSSEYNDLFFYGASIRATANGNASGDVEFNQQKGDGTTTAGCRTANDRLVAYDFLNGGTSLQFHVLTWIDSAHPGLGGNSGTCYVKNDSMPCWGANVITPSGATFDGQANQSAIAAADNGISGAPLNAQQFAEFGVDLTEALTGKTASQGGTIPCFPQQVWESRSSGSSFTSNPEDIEFSSVSTCGSVKIIKQTDPRGVDQNFTFHNQDIPTGGDTTFNPALDGSGNFTLNDKGNTTGNSECSSTVTVCNTEVIQNVPTGTWHVTESPVTGFDPTGVTGTGCSLDTSVSPAVLTISVTAGQSVTCTLTNTERGSIKVVKNTDPSSATSTSFDFTPSGFNGGSTITLAGGGGNQTFNNIVPATTSGTYTVSEDTPYPSGWVLDTVTNPPTCDSGTPSDTSDDTAPGTSIVVLPGKTTTCTFTNIASATLKIEKSSVGGTGSFGFTTDGTGPTGFTSGFSIDTSTTNPNSHGPDTFSGLQLGDKYVTETAPTGWTLTNISCTAGGATIAIGTGQGTGFDQNATAGFDQGDDTVKVTLHPGDSPDCTFTNTKDATLTITKDSLGTGGGSFGFATAGSGPSSFTSGFSIDTSTTDPNSHGPDTFSGFQLGDKYVKENVPAGWTLTNITCTGNGASYVIGTGSDSSDFANGGSDTFDKGDTTVKVSLAAGNTPECTFTDTPLGAILITKKSTKGTLLSGASFKVTTDEAGDNQVSGSPKSTGSDGTACIDGLPFTDGGTTYYVTETGAPTGYKIADTTAQAVTVDTVSSCSSTADIPESQQLTFTDPPLTTLEVIATSEASGGTKSTISCTDHTGATVGMSITTYTNPADWKTLHLPPDTYTCTVVIDP